MDKCYLLIYFDTIDSSGGNLPNHRATDVKFYTFAFYGVFISSWSNHQLYQFIS